MKNLIYKICKDIKKLSDEDFEEIRQQSQNQVDFSHPLKNATVSRINNLGTINLKILEHLDAIKTLIYMNGEELKKKIVKL